MVDHVGTLVAAIIGGMLTAGGAIVADWLKSRREQRHTERERLRENLYKFQDDLNDLFDRYRFAVESVTPHGAPFTQAEHARLSNARQRLVMQTLRIGDDELDHHLSQALLNLNRIQETTDPEEAAGLLAEISRVLMPPVFSRMWELLHTDETVRHAFSGPSVARQRESESGAPVQGPPPG